MLAALHTSLRHWINRRVFQLRDHEPGEVYLNQRRVFIVPGKPGLVFCIMLVALFVGSINYSLSLGFAFTFLIAACAVIDMHFTFRNLAHLYLAAGRTQPVFAGEDAQFELRLINRRKHDRYALWLGFIGHGLPDLEQPVDIPAQNTCSVTLTAPATTRGWMPAPRVRLQTRFPLGLLRAWSYWQPDAKTLVYPRPEDDAPPLPMASAGHADGTGTAGHDDFAGVRAYQAGDSLKLLAWRQIARINADGGDTLISKHFEGGAASELSIDLTQLPSGMDLESKLSRMTRWVIEAEARQLRYAFHLGDAVFSASIGPAHRAACLQALALYGTSK